MNITLAHEHRWDLSPYEAQQVQKSLQARVLEESSDEPIATVAGIEIAHSRFQDTLVAAVSLLRFPDMNVIEEATVEYRSTFPYIPGLLSFREVPAVVAALERLSELPDLLLVDGPGIAHPHKLGVASHLGVLLDRPTIGCSRSVLVGSYVEPEVTAGSQSALVWQGEIIGTVYRSKNRVAPLFISVGHRTTRIRAQELVAACCQGYRLPEPTRHAHVALNHARSDLKTAGAAAEGIV
ncbi:MAG: deoxyribonuclease V [Candidatus Sericytochromatia bacterium]|nr:deoxyribonuclease V [Candidatus Sericytochromatia bacterium]